MKLLDIIRTTKVGRQELAICWLGQAGFCLKDMDGHILMFDPYFSNCGERMRGFKRLSAKLVDPAEAAPHYYITTHLHFDHFDYDAIPVVAQNSPHTFFLGPSPCMERLVQSGANPQMCCCLNCGDMYEDETISVRAVWADHGLMAPEAIGVLLEMGGHRLYFSGDTAFHEDLFRTVASFRPEIVFLSVNGQFGNMDAQEGVEAARLIGAKYAVPCHIWTFMEHQGDLYGFWKGIEKLPECTPRCFSQGEIQLLDQAGRLTERENAVYELYEGDSLYETRGH